MTAPENRYDALDDESLLRYVADEAGRRRERLSIEERGAKWVAELSQGDGFSSGRTLSLAAAGPDRRTALLALAEKMKIRS
jgi:hypothetical protein